MKDIAVAVALYNNEKEVIEFAKGLLKQTAADRIQLLVTCNACKDVEAFKRDMAEVMPSAKVFDPGKNLGYLNGCLYGVKGSVSDYSWVMVSNTDIEFKEQDFFERAVENISEDIWCISPDIVLSATGVHQNPFLKERPSKKRVMIWKTAYSNYLFFRLYFKLSELKPKKPQTGVLKDSTVYAVHGSCFILSRDCVKSLLPVCRKIFMYGEELLVAEVIHKNKKKSLFKASVGIVHNENQVTGSIGRARKQKWFKNSFNYLTEKFFKN